MLARQVEVVAIGQEIVDHLVELLPTVEQLVRIDADNRAAGDVADAVAAATQRRESDSFHSSEHFAEVFDLQPVQLHVLARRKLRVVASEFDRELAEGAVLGRGQDATGRLHAQHEVADFRLVLIQPIPLETHHVFFGDVEVVFLGEVVNLVDDFQRELFSLQALDVVSLQDQIPVRRRASRRGRWPSSGLRHGGYLRFRREPFPAPAPPE